MAVSKKNKGLGKGLGALLPNETIPGNEGRTVLELTINDINPNEDQPRKQFDDERLQELAASIKENGVIQPIIVTKVGEHYKIVAGERRWRAARLAGLRTIPAIVRELTDHEVLQQALIENVQRQDLNVLEEAAALDRLIREYGMTQEAVGKVVGKSRPAITNTLRLMHLPEEIQELLLQETLSAGHARALLALRNEDEQVLLAKKICSEELSVRETEKWIRRRLEPPKAGKKTVLNPQITLSIRSVEEKLGRHLKTKVRLQDNKNKGKIIIEYYSAAERERICEQLFTSAERTVSDGENGSDQG